MYPCVILFDMHRADLNALEIDKADAALKQRGVANLDLLTTGQEASRMFLKFAPEERISPLVRSYGVSVSASASAVRTRSMRDEIVGRKLNCRVMSMGKAQGFNKVGDGALFELVAVQSAGPARGSHWPMISAPGALGGHLGLHLRAFAINKLAATECFAFFGPRRVAEALMAFFQGEIIRHSRAGLVIGHAEVGELTVVHFCCKRCERTAAAGGQDDSCLRRAH